MFGNSIVGEEIFCSALITVFVVFWDYVTLVWMCVDVFEGSHSCCRHESLIVGISFTDWERNQ